MLAEDTSYTPLSSEPIDLAQRLRGYIEGLFTSADRDKEDPPWFISLCSREAKPNIERTQGCHTELSSQHPDEQGEGATLSTPGLIRGRNQYEQYINAGNVGSALRA
ncbi:MAG: hypothetical protein CMK07_10375 [Ponticaulis sp.]|nr:hypothetical protein [Ponticaulis sp.]